jgi:hypothetical protein
VTDWRRIARGLAAAGWLPESLGPIYRDCLDEIEEWSEAQGFAWVPGIFEEEFFEQARLFASQRRQVAKVVRRVDRSTRRAA